MDAEDFSMTIWSLLDSFVKKLWWDFIDEVHISISHPEMRVKRISEQKRVMTETITDDDIGHLSWIISEVSAEQNYETLKTVTKAAPTTKTLSKKTTQPIMRLRCDFVYSVAIQKF